MKESQLIRFSSKQRRVLTWWMGDGRQYDGIICDGAVRSGKTLSIGLSFVCWAMATYTNRQFGICGKTIVSLRRNIIHELLPNLRKLGFICQEKRSANYVTIRMDQRENRFYLFGGKDESSASLIQGVTLAGVFLDEVVLMPRSFVEQACARCSVTGSKLWFSCNPQGPQHWFYKEWILKAEQKRTLYLHFKMEDNPSLSTRVRARYRTAYSGVFYRRFVLGEWVAAQGLVYDFYDTTRDSIPKPQETMERYRISVDYGTANPTSMGLWGQKDGVWYRVDEYYYNSRMVGVQKTDAEYVEALRTLAGDRTVEQVIVDPSAASFIEAIRREGFHVVKADNNVTDGIRVTADLLKQRKMVLCQNCTDCLREMTAYCWEERSERDAPRKENDHAMDEMRYFAMSIIGETTWPLAVTYVERNAR